MKKSSPKPARRAADKESQSVTLRIQRQKVRELDELAARTGVVRSAHIQLAIAQYLERITKP